MKTLDKIMNWFFGISIAVCVTCQLLAIIIKY